MSKYDWFEFHDWHKVEVKVCSIDTNDAVRCGLRRVKEGFRFTIYSHPLG